MIPLLLHSRLLVAAAVVVLLAGVAVAVAKPGNLGDDGERSAAPVTTTTLASPTSTTNEPTSTTTSEPTTEPASGLGASGAGDAGEGGLADTGGPSWLLPGGVVLALAAVAARRLANRA